MVSRVDIALTPAEATVLPHAECYVVIDVLRATTTIAALFGRGLARLHVVSRIDEARKRKAPGRILLGEEGGLRPEGFDYGNSPVEAAGLDLTGREAVQVTSNGTKALCAVAPLGTVTTAAMANLRAAAAFLGRFETVTLVCSGNHGAQTFSLEDFAVAAALLQDLTANNPGLALGDAARLALVVGDPGLLIGRSEHAAILRGLGFGDDVEFARQRDTSDAVPSVTSHGDGWATLEPVHS